uniref:Uncharacterized protein n=1 Tax=Ciona intestinalis TaxID=7719 RepID=H2XT02_CIOIN
MTATDTDDLTTLDLKFLKERYQDTSLQVWKRNQLKANSTNTINLKRNPSKTYTSHGNKEVIVPDNTQLPPKPDNPTSKVCNIL